MVKESRFGWLACKLAPGGKCHYLIIKLFLLRCALNYDHSVPFVLQATYTFL